MAIACVSNPLHGQFDRVVKVMDSKSIGLCPQGFKSPSCRLACGACVCASGNDGCTVVITCVARGSAHTDKWNGGGSRAHESAVTHGAQWLADSKDTLAEWLRRRPAKPMGSPCVGSNPTGVVCGAVLAMVCHWSSWVALSSHEKCHGASMPCTRCSGAEARCPFESPLRPCI